MQNRSRANPEPNPKTEFRFERFVQISESHCGPAVLQMLLGNLGVVVSQEDLAEAGGVTDLIEMNGMRIDQMAEAVSKIAPGVHFWYKEQSTIEDLCELVQDHKFPVGVEWQGLFEDEDDDDDDDEDDDDEDDDDEDDDVEDSDEDEDDEDDDEDDEDDDDDDDDDDEDDSETGDDDYGHYSIVTFVDRDRELLIIADPYKDYADQDRIFTFKEFDQRWYDYNEITNPKTGRARCVKDDHVLFVITGEDETFPLTMGMKQHPKLDV